MLATAFALDHNPSTDTIAAANLLAAELERTSNLVDRLRLIPRAVAGKIAFSTSLGIEDQVLHHALVASQLPVDVLTLDTGRHFPETYETLSRTERAFGTRIRVVAPDADQVERLVARDGVFGFRQSIEGRKACCNIRKVQPLHRALADAAVWLTGMRRDQSGSRQTTSFAEFDTSLGLVKVNPIADWTLEQVEAYVRDHRVPVNALHAQGFPSIGCQPCTRAIAPGEPIRAGRWWWENEEHKECGLHFREPVARTVS